MTKRIAIVTGVSRLQGIGKAISIALAKRDIDIFFTYWTNYDKQMPWSVQANEPQLIRQEILDLGVNCDCLELDLTSENAPQKLLIKVKETMGNPSILINNATYSTTTDIANFSVTELDKHYALNVRATTLLTIEFIKQFAFSQGGRIINLTSGQSLGEMPNEIAYAMTKGAVETLTKTISQTIANQGITINAVNPGPNDTGWMDEPMREQLIQRFPMNRIGQPQDVAHLVGFLCSEEGEWITGQIIHSEGGFIR